MKKRIAIISALLAVLIFILCTAFYYSPSESEITGIDSTSKPQPTIKANPIIETKPAIPDILKNRTYFPTVQVSATADFNGNGILDFVTTDQVSRGCAVFLDWNSSISSANSILFAVHEITDLHVADIDNNGGKDLLLNDSIEKSVQFLLNRSGSLQSSFSFKTGSPWNGIFTINNSNSRLQTILISPGYSGKCYTLDWDVDREPRVGKSVPLSCGKRVCYFWSLAGPNRFGKSDITLAGVHNSSNEISIWAGDRSIHMDGITIPSQSPIDSIAVGDFNGNGCGDIVYLSKIESVVYTIEDPSKVEAPRERLVQEIWPNRLLSLAAGDITGDGVDDAVFCGYRKGKLFICNGNLDRGLNGVQSAISIGEKPSSLTLGDVDANGTLDIIVFHEGSVEKTIVINRGDGYFDQRK